jgi:carbamoyltransferase
LLEEFHRQTGCPVLVNTSFNVRGEPIVCTPQDAYRCLLATDMDALVLEDVIVLKGDVSDRVDMAERERHLAQFQLD